jgi:hypothetical protein
MEHKAVLEKSWVLEIQLVELLQPLADIGFILFLLLVQLTLLLVARDQLST